MNYFTVFFDKNYLSRGLVLINSLKRNSTAFKIYILCLDAETYDFFTLNKSVYKEIIPIKLKELEEYDLELKVCKENRSLIEYYFTLSPSLPLFILEKWNLPHICSLDADIKFYASPDPIFSYLETHSVIVTPHKFSDENKELVKYGCNNVSFQIFKNDETGLNCLKKWRNQCLEWCSDYFDEENQRFADQKYLDEWEDLYGNKVKVLNDNVSGLAIWNINSYTISKKGNQFLSNGENIIFYHFHNMKFLSNRWATNGFKSYHVRPNKQLTLLYANYWCDINKETTKLTIKEGEMIRGKMKNNLIDNLIQQESLFLRITNSKFIYVDLKKMNRILRRIILNIYAKRN
jgi:hypothetical protein